MSDITFIEGSRCDLVITVDAAISMAGKKARIQVRKVAGYPVLLEFSSEVGAANPLTVSGQTVVWAILPAVTEDKAGTYKWQMEVYSDETDIIKIAAENMIITPAIIKP